jgi:hypothetical protein
MIFPVSYGSRAFQKAAKAALLFCAPYDVNSCAWLIRFSSFHGQNVFRGIHIRGLSRGGLFAGRKERSPDDGRNMGARVCDWASTIGTGRPSARPAGRPASPAVCKSKAKRGRVASVSSDWCACVFLLGVLLQTVYPRWCRSASCGDS